MQNSRALWKSRVALNLQRVGHGKQAKSGRASNLRDVVWCADEWTASDLEGPHHIREFRIPIQVFPAVEKLLRQILA